MSEKDLKEEIFSWYTFLINRNERFLDIRMVAKLERDIQVLISLFLKGRIVYCKRSRQDLLTSSYRSKSRKEMLLWLIIYVNLI